MKRAAIVLVLVVVTIAAIDVLADLTQSRPDPVRDDAAVTELVVEVDEDRFRPGEAAAADALWAVCSAQTASQATGPAQALGDSRYRWLLAPAVGEHDERKLVGCLEDFTIERVVGDVRSVRDRQAQPATNIRP